jgi:hypothetical protein
MEDHEYLLMFSGNQHSAPGIDSTIDSHVLVEGISQKNSSGVSADEKKILSR